jgi:hypothetical protein
LRFIEAHVECKQNGNRNENSRQSSSVATARRESRSVVGRSSFANRTPTHDEYRHPAPRDRLGRRWTERGSSVSFVARELLRDCIVITPSTSGTCDGWTRSVGGRGQQVPAPNAIATSGGVETVARCAGMDSIRNALFRARIGKSSRSRMLESHRNGPASCPSRCTMTSDDPLNCKPYTYYVRAFHLK